MITAGKKTGNMLRMFLLRIGTSGGLSAQALDQQGRIRGCAIGIESGVEQVIAAAQADPALREAAVRALGQASSDRAAGYVASALHDEDPTVQCTAIGVWEAMKGEAAIPDIAKLLEENRERPDGCSVEVAEACVKALGATRSSEALPVLETELQWVAKQKEGQAVIDYGNAVIEAVADIGDSRSATMLENFAEALQGKLSGRPTIRRQQMLQMAEAYVKADELR